MNNWQPMVPLATADRVRVIQPAAPAVTALAKKPDESSDKEIRSLFAAAPQLAACNIYFAPALAF